MGKPCFWGKPHGFSPWVSREILGNPTVPGSDFAAVREADRDDVIVTREALEVHGFLELLRDLPSGNLLQFMGFYGI